MLVPRLKAARRVVQPHEPHAAFHQAAGQETLAAEYFGLLLIDAVVTLRRRRFLGQVEGFRGLQLHTVSQLEGFDAGAQPAVLGTLLTVQFIEAPQSVQVAAWRATPTWSWVRLRIGFFKSETKVP